MPKWAHMNVILCTCEPLDAPLQNHFVMQSPNNNKFSLLYMMIMGVVTMST